MVAGHLREKRGYYHMVLSYTDENGKRQTPSKSTGLPVKGNKKRAEALLMQARKEKEAELQLKMAQKEQQHFSQFTDILFTQFMSSWVDMMKNSVEDTTYAAYSMTINKKIVPYFNKKYPGLLLREVTPKYIQDYYTHEMNVNGLSANTVIHRHANIRKALQYAMKTGLILSNPADLVERPKKIQYVGGFYNEKELEKLFEAVKGDPIELGVIVAAFYGLRRSEVVGLKWDAIDFEKKTVTIRHTVTQMCLDGKSTVIQKDRTKTKSSYRTLPLVEPFEELLLRLKEGQEQNRKLCGRSYSKKYTEYIYVDQLGQLIKPGYITQHFPQVLEKNGLRKIRFHDLRHSCASLLHANGVSMNQRAEAVVKNIYVSFFDYSSRHVQSLTLTSANILTATYQNIVKSFFVRVNELCHFGKPENFVYFFVRRIRFSHFDIIAHGSFKYLCFLQSHREMRTNINLSHILV